MQTSENLPMANGWPYVPQDAMLAFQWLNVAQCARLRFADPASNYRGEYETAIEAARLASDWHGCRIRSSFPTYGRA